MLDLSQKQTEQKLKLTYAALDLSVVLSWRFPATEEHVGYQIDKYRKTEGFRLSAGLNILTGIRDGDFGVEGNPLSSNPDSPDYRADWKDALKGNPTAAKIIEDLAYTVFEETLVMPDREPTVPFVKS